MTEQSVSGDAIFFDLGGTLLALDEHDEIAHDHRNRVTPLPGVVRRLCDLKAEGFRLYVITNQSGVSRGDLTSDDVAGWIGQINVLTGHSISDYAYCPHAIDCGCPCRKPRPGLVNTLAQRHALDLTAAVLVGDSATDRACAQSAGLAFCWAPEYFALLQ